MKIVKNNGGKQEFMPNKILKRIKNVSKDLKVNHVELFQKVVPSITDGITTTEIDEIIAFKSADMIINHPDYSILGGRILLTRQGKLLNVDLEPVDLNYDFFAAITFLEKYSIKDNNKVPLELPSMMYDRIATTLYPNDSNNRKELYNELVSKKGSFATPILTNTGVDKRGSLISCNKTMFQEDSLDGIENTKRKVAEASKAGAGIGGLLDPIRSKYSMVSSFKNNAGGIMKLMKMIEPMMEFYKQGDRSGSFSPYLSIWHRDIEDFLSSTLPTGEESQRVRKLFTGVIINDLFMKTLIDNGTWYLFCPNDIKKAGLKPLYDLLGDDFEVTYNKAIELGLGTPINAQSLWAKLIQSQVESGRPYVMFKENMNWRWMQDNIGIVKFANLCVVGDTNILTGKGYIPIKDLVGKTINIWNGREWSEVTPFNTGKNEVMEVTLSDGSILSNTLYHHYYIYETNINGSVKRSKKVIKVESKDLKIGDALIKFSLPVIEGHKELKYPYTQGFYSGDGNHGVKSLPHTKQIVLYGDKIKLLNNFDIRDKIIPKSNGSIYDIGNKAVNTLKTYSGEDKIVLKVPENIKDKLFVPNSSYTINSRLTWIGGILDSDGSVMNGETSSNIQLTSINKQFLLSIKDMLQEIGVHSKVTKAKNKGVTKLPYGKGGSKYYDTKPLYRLLISSASVYHLLDLGLKCHRLKFNDSKLQRDCNRFVRVKDIKFLNKIEDTYCFTEPKRNMGMFNGILTGQCTEFLGVSLPTYTSQCTLASINLAAHNSLESIANTTGIFVRALNQVIDINKWSDEWSEIAGLDQRALAIGVAGMADYFAINKISFESEKAKELSKSIFETMYKSAVIESNKLGEKYGAYPAWKGSKYEKGETYIEGWSPIAKGVPIKMRNSLLLGLMPTATTAGLLGVFESFEPVNSNIFNRTVGQGNFTRVNKYLVKELHDLGLWTPDIRNLIIINDGSVQNIEQIPDDIQYRYKTVWEISQRVLLDLAIIRNKYVDQSQSMNVYHVEPKLSKISSALVHAWKGGLKTGSYYTRVRSKLNNNKKLSVNSTPLPTKPENSIIECFGCQS